MVLSGISSSFPELSLSERQIIYVLLTRAPLPILHIATKDESSDLHVLGTPPALVLSQNQTLHKNYYNLNRLSLFLYEASDLFQNQTLLLHLFDAVINRYHYFLLSLRNDPLGVIFKVF